jgi:hypothetical protein
MITYYETGASKRESIYESNETTHLSLFCCLYRPVQTILHHTCLLQHMNYMCLFVYDVAVLGSSACC